MTRQGSGWYGESRRHAEAAKKGRPVHSRTAVSPRPENKPPSSIWYAGHELKHSLSTDSDDEAQAMLDYYKRKGREAACTHTGDQHHVYAMEPRQR